MNVDGYKIFIVEDNGTIVEILFDQFLKWGFTPKTVGNFNNVLNEFLEFEPDIVLLDISLPFYNGFHWCSEIRKISKVPIIFLSSSGENMNQIMAINMGADDFIVKPFEIDFLIAKVNALLRRTYDFKSVSKILNRDGVILDLESTRVSFEKNSIELSKNEFMILKIIMESAGKIISRDKIMKYLWDDESFVDDNTLTVNINRVRKKLETVGAKNFIQTKKGLGYFWEKSND